MMKKILVHILNLALTFLILIISMVLSGVQYQKLGRGELLAYIAAVLLSYFVAFRKLSLKSAGILSLILSIIFIYCFYLFKTKVFESS